MVDDNWLMMWAVLSWAGGQFSQSASEPVVSWASGQLSQWSAEPVSRWSAEPVVSWASEPVVSWASGQLSQWSASGQLSQWWVRVQYLLHVYPNSSSSSLSDSPPAVRPFDNCNTHPSILYLLNA